jgi:hypothetical protein
MRTEHRFQTIPSAVHIEHTLCTYERKDGCKGSSACYLHTCFMPVSCMANSSTLKMEEKCSSKMSVDFQRITRPYIPEDRTLHIHRCENLKSYMHERLFACLRIQQGSEK